MPAAVTPAEAAALRLRFQPAVSYIKSAWPIDRIWQVNQRGGDEAIDLDEGAVYLQITRCAGAVVLCPLTPAQFEFRQALQQGASFAAASAAAAAVAEAVGSEFDSSAAWSLLLNEEELIAAGPR